MLLDQAIFEKCDLDISNYPGLRNRKHVGFSSAEFWII